MVLSSEVADRVERVDGEYLSARVGALSDLAGNPYGAAVRRPGRGYAFVVRASGNPLFNHVLTPDSETVAQLGELSRWYASYGRPLRAEVAPAHASGELFAALSEHGLRQTGFYAGLYREPPTTPTAPADGTVRVEPADMEEFADCYVRGFAFIAERRGVMADSVRVLAERADTQFFRARLESRTAGVALLFQNAGTGYLATAAVLPEYRRRGVQTALVHHRIDAATLAGCDLIVGHAAVGSVSQRTMERCGLRLAHTKAVWTQVQ